MRAIVPGRRAFRAERRSERRVRNMRSLVLLLLQKSDYICICICFAQTEKERQKAGWQVKMRKEQSAGRIKNKTARQVSERIRHM